MPDRERRDLETRKRVDELAESWNHAVERFQRWQRRVAFWLVAGMLSMLAVVILGFLMLQGSRWEQTRDACDRTNDQTEATVLLLKDVGARPEVILRAQVRYPHVPPLAYRVGDTLKSGTPPDYDGPMTCDEAASERVQGPKL